VSVTATLLKLSRGRLVLKVILPQDRPATPFIILE